MAKTYATLFQDAIRQQYSISQALDKALRAYINKRYAWLHDKNRRVIFMRTRFFFDNTQTEKNVKIADALLSINPESQRLNHIRLLLANKKVVSGSLYELLVAVVDLCCNASYSLDKLAIVLAHHCYECVKKNQLKLLDFMDCNLREISMLNHQLEMRSPTSFDAARNSVLLTRYMSSEGEIDVFNPIKIDDLQLLMHHVFHRHHSHLEHGIRCLIPVCLFDNKTWSLIDLRPHKKGYQAILFVNHDSAYIELIGAFGIPQINEVRRLFLDEGNTDTAVVATCISTLLSDKESQSHSREEDAAIFVDAPQLLGSEAIAEIAKQYPRVLKSEFSTRKHWVFR